MFKSTASLKRASPKNVATPYACNVDDPSITNPPPVAIVNVPVKFGFAEATGLTANVSFHD